MARMKRSEIYQKAAQLVLESAKWWGNAGRPSCLAISDVMGMSDDLRTPHEARDYAELFRPHEDKWDNILIWGRDWAYDDSAVMNCRVLALCFMSAIAAYEERATGKKRSAGTPDNAVSK